MLFTALFIRAPNWKLPKFPQIAEWRGELSFVHIIRNTTRQWEGTAKYTKRG